MKKKITAALLAGVMVLSMTACGSSSASSDSTTDAGTADTTTETESEAESETTEVTADTVEGALSGVTLKVGTSGLFAPFSYYDSDGTTLIGYDLDFLAALQDYLGFEIDGEVQAMDYSALTTSVAEGNLDIAMAALCATDERKEVMNFSDTYYDSGQTVMINTETSPAELTSVEDLLSGDYTVAVEKGTASHLYCTNAGIPESCIEVHDTITTAYESLEQGMVDAVIQDLPGAVFYCNTTEDTKLAVIGDQFNQGQAPYAIAVSFDCTDANDGIVEIFNQAIVELTENGTMDTINAKWFE